MVIVSYTREEEKKRRKEEFYDNYVRTLIEEAKGLGISKEELLTMIKEA